MCCVLLGYCSDSLAFATEPVLGSLANLLGAVERLPINCQQELKVDPPPCLAALMLQNEY